LITSQYTKKALSTRSARNGWEFDNEAEAVEFAAPHGVAVRYREARARWIVELRANASAAPAPTPVGTGKKASEVAAKVGSRSASEAGDLTFGEATLVSRFDWEDRGEAEKGLAGGRIDLYLDGWIIEAKEKPTRGAVEHAHGTLDRRIRDAEFVLEFVGTAALFGSRPSDDDIEFLHEKGHVVIYEDENGLFTWVRP
jgi:hypothetical protein